MPVKRIEIVTVAWKKQSVPKDFRVESNLHCARVR